MSESPTLTVTWQGAVRTFRLESDKPVRLGRHPLSEVPFDPQRDLIVSSLHAKVVRLCGTWTLVDLESRNGVWLALPAGERQRVLRATLEGGEEFELGRGGPLVRFDRPAGEMGRTKKFGVVAPVAPQAPRRVALEARPIVAGRDKDCDIPVPDSRASRRHAIVERHGDTWFVRDLDSRNGTFVNGERVARQALKAGDRLIVGGRRIEFQTTHLTVYEAEIGAGLECRSLVRDHDGKMALDDVWLGASPGDLVAVMGPSGCGKTALLDALCGVRAPDSGSVQIGGTSLYDSPAAVRLWIGHVGHEVALHEDRTVASLLATAASLRLPEHTNAERRDRLERVLADVELTNHRDKRVDRLTPLQRRRLQMGVELVQEPAVLCFDEPSRGLDPSDHYTLVRLAREMATAGRTVLVATRAVTHLELFDQIAFLVDGKLTFYGRPGEALEHFGAEKYEDLFHACRSRDAAEWRDRYRVSTACRRFLPGYLIEMGTPVAEAGAGPLFAAGSDAPAGSGPVRVPRVVPRTRNYAEDGAGKRGGEWETLGRGFRILQVSARDLTGREAPGGLRELIRQLIVLGKQDLERLADNRDELLWLAAGAPLALGLAFGVAAPRLDAALLWLALGAWWLAAHRAAPELVSDRAVYMRDRRVNMRIASYLLARFMPLAITAMVQSLVLLAAVVHVGGIDLPLVRTGLLLALAACAGTAGGLAASAASRTATAAHFAVVPMLLFCLLFSGAFESDTPPASRGLVATLDRLSPSYWTFDQLKRLAVERGAPDRYQEERKIRELEARQDRLSGELAALSKVLAEAMRTAATTPARVAGLATDIVAAHESRSATLVSLRDAHRRRLSALPMNHLGSPDAGSPWLGGLVVAGLGLAAGLLRYRELAGEA